MSFQSNFDMFQKRNELDLYQNPGDCMTQISFCCLWNRVGNLEEILTKNRQWKHQPLGKNLKY